MLRILIVDDDEVLVEHMVEFFNRCGWDAHGAHDGKEALAKLNTSFDAVVLDVQMPVMHGEQTLAEIRKRFELDGVCVVLLTAYATVGSAIRSIRLGAHQYLEKPFDLSLLKKVLIAGIARQKISALRGRLLASLGMDTILREIGAILSETVVGSNPYLVLLDDAGSITSIQRGTTHFDDAELDRLRAAGSRRFVQEILHHGRPVFVGDSARISEWGPFLTDAKAMLAAPIPASGGRVAGIIDLESAEDDALDASWEDVLVYLADLAGIAMEIAGKVRENAALSAAKARVEADASAARAEAETDARAEREMRERMILLVRELGHRLLTPVQVITFEADAMMAKDFKATTERGTSSSRPGSMLRRRIDAIRSSASEVAGVCQYLRDVSRDIPVDIRPVPLLGVVHSCMDVHLSEFESKRISLTMPDETSNSVQVRADPGLLKYSLECLVRNAIEAIEKARKERPTPPKGKHRNKVEEDRITVGIELDDQKKMVSISVADTGTGVPEQDRKRLFVALFTTKERPYPAGTGLFSVNRYMVLQGGSIELGSSSGTGATFVLKIPLDQK